jgi:hypothetical protein
MSQVFTLDWYTIDGGGGSAAGPTFSLQATIGQPDAGTEVASANFLITGGFWVAGDVGCDGIDFNRDGVFPDNQDIVDFIEVFAGGTCPTGTCNDIDFNNDGVFPDNQDIIDYIDVFAGGTC